MSVGTTAGYLQRVASVPPYLFARFPRREDLFSLQTAVAGLGRFQRYGLGDSTHVARIGLGGVAVIAEGVTMTFEILDALHTITIDVYPQLNWVIYLIAGFTLYLIIRAIVSFLT